jgi:prepilin-type N-terminal cleavage/methylation domain-containing protein
MHSLARRLERPKSGFTIIEVLIVLGIVGLIFVIIFLAVPKLLRTGRDHERKQAANYVMARMYDYQSLYGNYPKTPNQDDRDGFKASLHNGELADKYTIRYDDSGAWHTYPFSGGDSPANPLDAADTISIAPGHRCNRAPGIGPGDADYPLKLAPDFGASPDHDHRINVVWIYLEAGRVYCVDTQN